MSNKTLLNEAQVRKFMKLACLEPLAAGFVHGLSERSRYDMEESHGSGKAELNQTDDGMGRHTNRAGQLAEEEGLDDMALDAEEDTSDMEQDLDDLGDVAVADEEAVADDGRMIAVDDFLSALESALESAMGDEVEIDASEMSDDSEHDEHEEENAEDDMEHAADLEDDADEDMGDLMQEEEGSKKGEYRRKDKDGKVGKKAGEGKDGHYKDYEGPEGGNKGDESKTHPGKKDYEKNESVAATDDLVEAITKRVAARILKSALAKK
jgi:hypothetical protein